MSKPRAFQAPRAIRCVWPGCQNARFDTYPLCHAHVIVVASTYRENESNLLGRVTVQPEPEPEAPASKPEPELGVVYFLRIGGYIKIGWTSDLAKRMRQYPPDSLLLAVAPGTRADEAATHKRFAHLKTHGREWFPLAAQIIEYADRIVATHGEPPSVHFSAKRAEKKYPGREPNYIGGPGRGNLAKRTVRG